jgi:hypothetical protein
MQCGPSIKAATSPASVPVVPQQGKVLCQSKGVLCERDLINRWRLQSALPKLEGYVRFTLSIGIALIHAATSL